MPARNLVVLLPSPDRSSRLSRRVGHDRIVTCRLLGHSRGAEGSAVDRDIFTQGANNRDRQGLPRTWKGFMRRACAPGRSCSHIAFFLPTGPTSRARPYTRHEPLRVRGHRLASTTRASRPRTKHTRCICDVLDQTRSHIADRIHWRRRPAEPLGS